MAFGLPEGSVEVMIEADDLPPGVAIAMFGRKADANDDHVVTKEEWEAFLAQAKADDAGVLSAEALAGLAPQDVPTGPAAFLVGLLDRDGDGKVEIEDLKAWFDAADANHDGKVDATEIVPTARPVARAGPVVRAGTMARVVPDTAPPAAPAVLRRAESGSSRRRRDAPAGPSRGRVRRRARTKRPGGAGLRRGAGTKGPRGQRPRPPRRSRPPPCRPGPSRTAGAVPAPVVATSLGRRAPRTPGAHRHAGEVREAPHCASAAGVPPARGGPARRGGPRRRGRSARGGRGGSRCGSGLECGTRCPTPRASPATQGAGAEPPHPLVAGHGAGAPWRTSGSSPWGLAGL